MIFANCVIRHDAGGAESLFLVIITMKLANCGVVELGLLNLCWYELIGSTETEK